MEHADSRIVFSPRDHLVLRSLPLLFLGKVAVHVQQQKLRAGGIAQAGHDVVARDRSIG